MSADAFSPVVFPRFRDADAEALRERERERGYADGHAQGFRAGAALAAEHAARADALRSASDDVRHQDVAAAVAALRTAADVFAAQARRLVAATEREVSARAIELAELIVADELTDADVAAVIALRRALDAHEMHEVHEIRLSPPDLQVLVGQGAVPEDVRVTADAALRPGDAVVIVEDGLVDARIAAALDRARAVSGGLA